MRLTLSLLTQDCKYLWRLKRNLGRRKFPSKTGGFKDFALDYATFFGEKPSRHLF
jgi:hypothetical protein